MTHWKFRTLWSALVIAILLGLLWQFIPLDDAKNRLATLPYEGAQFSGRDISLSPFEKGTFAPITVVKRLYEISGKDYFLTILDGTHDRHLVHDPYYCFKGSGWQVIASKDYPLQRGNVQLVTLKKGETTKQALYWFSDGHLPYTSPLHYWWQATLRRLTLGYSGPEPVLVVLQPLTPKTDIDWKEVLSQFSPLFKV